MVGGGSEWLKVVVSGSEWLEVVVRSHITIT